MCAPHILEDTRQKVGKHERKRLWFEAHGIRVERRALLTGDYERADGTSNVLVDTKRSISEVAMDVGRDHKRFVKELDRARDAGYRLVILIEVGAPYKGLPDVVGWVNDACKRCEHRRNGRCDPTQPTHCAKFRRKPMSGATLARTMKTLELEHGCRFEFVHPRKSAQRICELLGLEVMQ